MSKLVDSDNFILTYISDGFAYPVFLDEEQEQMFKFAITIVSAGKIIKIGEKPIGKVATLKEIGYFKEGGE